MSSQEDINPESSLDTPSTTNSKDSFFDPKPQPKIIRVLTVMAYVLSVSMAAILLSIYYIFMWDGRPHLGARVSGPEFGLDNISIPEFQPKSSTTLISFHFGKTNQSLPTLGKLSAESFEKDTNHTRASLLYLTTLEENSTLDHRSSTEMQQQFIAVESEQLRAYTTDSPTYDENTTESIDYDGMEDLGKTSPFIKKLMGNYEADY
nr:uncharacterized protein LOC111509534 [Leptinotarsa decemlineata]